MDMYYYKRSVGVAILLTFLTCGIYGIYWYYQVLTSLYRLNNLPSNAGLDIVLTFVTCGIYGIYLAYKLGKLESTAHYMMALPPRDDAILYLILTIFGFGIIAYAIVQSNINTMVDQVMARGPHGPYGGGPHGPYGGPGFGPGPGYPGQGPQNPQPPQNPSQGQQDPWNQGPGNHN